MPVSSRLDSLFLETVGAKRRRAAQRLRLEDLRPQGFGGVPPADPGEISLDGMAGGAPLIESGASGCGVARRQRCARELLVLRALTRVVNPPRDSPDLLLAQIGELRHGG